MKKKNNRERSKKKIFRQKTPNLETIAINTRKVLGLPLDPETNPISNPRTCRKQI